ncbi:MAG: M3 family metallopeptidase [Dysgonamonadaceae bacterium]|nr:M3 family metallopeptidase [Dysgonamonadaceae bacterium]
MKKLLFVVMIVGIALTSCSKKQEKSGEETGENPFFSEWTTPFGVPPFDKIKVEHYKPAFDKGLEEHKKEIEVITNNEEKPGFENTILALDSAGELLSKVSGVFFNLAESDGLPGMDEIKEEYEPVLTKHNDEIYMNEKLFARVKAVYDERSGLGLGAEENRLIEKYYKNFVRGGTSLSPEDKAKVMKINEEIVVLTNKFGKNLLAENNRFQLVITDRKDLSGLPESSINAAAEFAEKEGKEGWIFTLHKPSWIPFMQFADNRVLREKMYKAYINRGNNNDDLDNKVILEKIVSLRTQKANIMGYKTWADFIISDNMAKTPAAANALIDQVAKATIPYAKQEASELQKIMNKAGENFKPEGWDWWYYTEKLRKERYNLDEESVRPYFSLESTQQGLFLLCNKLWGLQFEKLTNLPVYHEEVMTYEVKDRDGSHLGIMYFDFFPRATKRGGAWMENIRPEYFKDGMRSAPVIVNVCNFTRPVGDTPSLLSIDEAETMFHEFGHALHGLLTQCKYRSTSGTNVPSDFVELPSQIMENWVLEPQMLKLYAKHYQTGEIIPDSLIAKIQAARAFNQGFVTMELIAASALDMDWHMLTDTVRHEAVAFETAAMKKLGLIKEIAPRYSSWYFNHIFGSDPGYSAGYYAYTWSAVLDADAYQAFVETGDIFNPEVAAGFRKFVLEKGDSDDPAILYREFRSKDATPDAYLKRKGFVRKPVF